MEDHPSLVILTLHDKKGEDIVKGILDSEVLPAPAYVKEKIQAWPWKINNKYYSADIRLTYVESAETHMQWILRNGEALIIYCNSTEETAIENLNGLLESLGDFEPEVQLLVCDACASEDDSPGLSRLKAQQWCISNRWELIELNKVEDDDSVQEDDFPESWGFQRIKQALHANTWSNLEMTDDIRTNSLNAVIQSVVSMDDRNSEIAQLSDEVMYSRLEDLSILDDSSENPLSVDSIRLQGQNSIEATEDAMNSSLTLEEYLQGGDQDFERLFSNFEQMKQTAASLPPQHRRDYAEKVAISFWKAIGGPDDELDGLDSD